jgi:hypothetical protein
MSQGLSLRHVSWKTPAVLIGLAVLFCLAATGLLVGLMLGIRSAAELVLAAYVVAFAEVVAVSLLLSPFNALTRASLIAATVILFAAAGASWLLRGAPRRSRPDVREAFAAWPVRVLALVVALALAYVVALIVGTPPNGWDPLNYHLARAAFWLQAQHIGYIPHAYDERLNFNPPNGEIGMSFALGVTRDESAAGFVQFFAALAGAVAVFALARRLAVSRAQALFGGLLFLTLPIVLLQSSGAKNDLIVASFILAACVFLRGSSRGSIALASLATALALGTKFTGAYALPILVGLALVAFPRKEQLSRCLWLATGALVGAYWYVVNAKETGHFLGDQSNAGTLTAPLHPRENLLTAYGDAVDTLDVSGTQGRDLLLYVGAAAVAAIAAAVSSQRRREALVIGLVTLSPIALLAASTQIGRPTLLRFYDFLGKPDGYLAVGDAVASSPRTASDTASWFGPLGFLFVVAVGVGALALARRRALGRAVALAAGAPFIWFVLVSLTLTYHPWQGRFFIPAVGLSAALWGVSLRHPALAWSAVALAAVTTFLCLDHYVEKPARSVWSESRWQVQSQHDPAVGPLFRFVDEHVPAHDAIAIALGPNEFSFPLFGPKLTRRVELIPSASTRWLFADAERSAQVDTTCWQKRLQTQRGAVFERKPGCA